MQRREALVVLSLPVLLGLSACNGSAREHGDPKRSQRERAAMLVHRDPNCGCCEAWAQMAAAEGYEVTLVDEVDMIGLKRRLGVPASLASCHTAEIEGAVIEGHVPFAAVTRFLAERPANAIGLAVPGMPVGSPGMEVPGRPPEPYVVHVFDAAGQSRPYWSSPGSAEAFADQG